MKNSIKNVVTFFGIVFMTCTLGAMNGQENKDAKLAIANMVITNHDEVIAACQAGNVQALKALKKAKKFVKTNNRNGKFVITPDDINGIVTSYIDTNASFQTLVFFI